MSKTIELLETERLRAALQDILRVTREVPDNPLEDAFSHAIAYIQTAAEEALWPVEAFRKLETPVIIEPGIIGGITLADMRTMLDSISSECQSAVTSGGADAEHVKNVKKVLIEIAEYANRACALIRHLTKDVT